METQAHVFRKAAKLIETEGWKAGGVNEEDRTCEQRARCIYIAVHDAGTAAGYSGRQIMDLDFVLIDYFGVEQLGNVFLMNDSFAPHPNTGKMWAIQHLSAIADSLED